MRVAFMFRGAIRYANQGPKDSPPAAIVRSLARRLGAEGATLAFQERDNLDREVWTFRAFLPAEECFIEEQIAL